MAHPRRIMLWPALCLCLATPADAQDGSQVRTGQEETYDLLFRTGTLDGIEGPLRYDRAAGNSTKPDMADRDTGMVEIAFEPAAEGSRQAILSFHQDGRERGLGTFPASVGNPIIMYFVESVVRDMAEIAGGSPFYIRNRVKDALVEPAEVTQTVVTIDGATVPARSVTLRPFEGDPNADRMQGFDGLTLTVTMGEEVPGWYQSLAAHIEGPQADRQDYASVLTFDGVGAEDAQ